MGFGKRIGKGIGMGACFFVGKTVGLALTIAENFFSDCTYKVGSDIIDYYRQEMKKGDMSYRKLYPEEFNSKGEWILPEDVKTAIAVAMRDGSYSPEWHKELLESIGWKGENEWEKVKVQGA